MAEASKARKKRIAKSGEARPAPLEPGDKRRHELLEAAYLLIGERGLEGLRTRDIAARAGVNISTLHYYFGTKEALLVAVVGHASSKFTERPASLVQGQGAGVKGARRDPRTAEPRPTLTAHLDGAWRTFKSTPHLSTVLQELVLRGQRDPATRAAFRELYEGWNGVVEQVLLREIQAGTLRRDLDPRAGARVVTSFIMGAMVQLGVNPKAFDFLELSRKLERWLAAA
jgi:AcrR family transcriptional regulator